MCARVRACVWCCCVYVVWGVMVCACVFLCVRTEASNVLLPIVEMGSNPEWYLRFIAAKLQPEARVRVHAQGISAPCSPLWSKLQPEACVCVHAQGLSAPCSPLWSKNA